MHALPQLTFLSVDCLVIHERHDEQRARPLMLRIRNSGVFRNPPIVTPLGDGSERYMVLDGANRVTALRLLGLPDALVQVCAADDAGLRLLNWNHVVWEMNAQRFMQGFRRIGGVRLVLETDAQAQASLEGDCRLALVQDCRGQLFSICTEADDLPRRVEILNAIVANYCDKARLDRTSLRDHDILNEVYPSFCGLVIFPTFQMADLLRLAGAGSLLPAGVTRFQISPRVLHLDYPLTELAASKTLAEKNMDLHQWIQQRIAAKRLRYYAEPTILFDE